MKEFWKIQMTHVLSSIAYQKDVYFFFFFLRNEGVDPMKKFKGEPILAADSITNKACASQTWIVLPASISYFFFSRFASADLLYTWHTLFHEVG